MLGSVTMFSYGYAYSAPLFAINELRLSPSTYGLWNLLTIIGMILVAGGTAGTVYIIQPLLDDIFLNTDTQMLYSMPFLVVGIDTAKSLGAYVQTYYISYIGHDIVRIMRDNLLKHILKLDMAYFQKKHGGELISRITNDINCKKRFL